MPCILSTLFWVYSAFSLSPRNNPSQIISVSLRSSLASPFTCAKVSSICAIETLLLKKNGIFFAEKVLTELPQDLHLIDGLGVRLTHTPSQEARNLSGRQLLPKEFHIT